MRQFFLIVLFTVFGTSQVFANDTHSEYDINADGVVEREELSNVFEKQFDQFDLNNNGFLSIEESQKAGIHEKVYGIYAPNKNDGIKKTYYVGCKVNYYFLGDKDGNGKVTHPEAFSAVAERMIKSTQFLSDIEAVEKFELGVIKSSCGN